MDRIWRDVRSIDELGGAMAGWLEGRIASQPGCSAGPDEETAPLVPVLARLNRRGFVTTCSQPGETGPAYDGQPWEQRAAVEGWISCRNPLLGPLIRRARGAGLIVTAYGPGRSIGPRRGLTVTRWGDEAHTGFGGRPRRFQRHAEMPGIGRGARTELRRHGVALAVIDPVWGRDTRLWPLLDRVIGYREHEPAAPTRTRVDH
ncbi:DUF6919 domain-containing protein [Streptomyces massasporeus]|uniref:DUF6919 domain-containing protein n=1 Tax=Streptomyces massasporeus TaxID=67324 RepID=UPI0036C1C9AF